MPTVKTTCTRDCPDACGLLVSVERGRISSIRGASEHPITRGFICYKQRYFLERVYGKRRVPSPLLKNGAGWRSISWNEAIDILAGRIESAIERSGPLSIFHYQGGGSLAALKMLNGRFFNLLGGFTSAGGSLCGGAGIAGQKMDFGKRASHDPLDLLNSKMIVLWGRNPAATNVHLMPLLKEAKERGAKVVLIDPLTTETSRHVDYQLKPDPGTDAYLALAIGAALMEMRLVDLDFISEHAKGFAEYESMVNRYSIDWLSRRCDVSANQIEELAMDYGTSKPAAILLGWGVQRYAWGGETFRLIDALAALTGNIGIPGGGVSHGMDESRHFDRSLIANDVAKVKREVSKARIGIELPLLVDPKVEVGLVSGANPAVQSPDASGAAKALAGLDFLAVIDCEMTKTAELADLVLPSATFLEENDVVGSYFHGYIGAVNRAADPPVDAKSDLEIFRLLAERLGISGMEGSDAKWIQRLLKPVKKDGITWDKLSEMAWMKAADPAVPFEDKRFFTESGRFEFIEEMPSIWGYDRDYPLALISSHPREWLHSEMTEEQLEKPFEVKLSPATASSLGLLDGDRARVSSRTGAFNAVVRIDFGIRDGVVACHQGRPLPDGPNAVTSQIASYLGNNACFYQSRVRLEKISLAL